jgi:hypothetical protein
VTQCDVFDRQDLRDNASVQATVTSVEEPTRGLLRCEEEPKNKRTAEGHDEEEAFPCSHLIYVLFGFFTIIKTCPQRTGPAAPSGPDSPSSAKPPLPSTSPISYLAATLCGRSDVEGAGERWSGVGDAQRRSMREVGAVACFLE